MNEFRTYHPLVNFTYFVCTIGFSMFFMHPICLIISLVCAFCYSVMLKGRRAIVKNLLYMFPITLITAVMNSLFNHGGVTIIEYLPSGNPLTLESVVYGLVSAVMLVSVICWFSCYNEVMTSDKFICLFGRVIPALSLILSMTLRFVPRFFSQLKSVRASRRALGLSESGGFMGRLRNALTLVSVMATWALENSIETADSMKSRGYGLPGRSSFTIFTFTRRDAAALTVTLVLGIYTLVGSILGGMYCRYFPSIKLTELTPCGISIFIAYFLLGAMPIIIELREVIKWKSLKSKI